MDSRRKPHYPNIIIHAHGAPRRLKYRRMSVNDCFLRYIYWNYQPMNIQLEMTGIHVHVQPERVEKKRRGRTAVQLDFPKWTSMREN